MANPSLGLRLIIIIPTIIAMAAITAIGIDFAADIDVFARIIDQLVAFVNRHSIIPT